MDKLDIELERLRGDVAEVALGAAGDMWICQNIKNIAVKTRSD